MPIYRARLWVWRCDVADVAVTADDAAGANLALEEIDHDKLQWETMETSYELTDEVVDQRSEMAWVDDDHQGEGEP